MLGPVRICILYSYLTLLSEFFSNVFKFHCVCVDAVSGIDINCGCPQGIARKGRYGAFLMEESVDIVCEIISTLRRDLPKNVGISCKMRIPENVGQPGGDEVLKERICKLNRFWS